jgi:hypothetical protein
MGSEKSDEGALVRVPDHVVYRAFDSETVLLNLDTGQYHGLNQSAGRMFDLLQRTGSPELTIEQVAREFRMPVETVADDFSKLCTELQERGLIEINGSSMS